MTGGFGSVPDDLFKAASAIGDAVGNAGSLVWNGPSGDYGHPGVQDGWSQFIGDVKSAVNGLARAADSHSDNLKGNAVNYTEGEKDAVAVIGRAAAGLGSSVGSRIGSILGGGESTSGGSDGSLAVPGAVGGGFTGNLSHQELDERFGIADNGQGAKD